MTRSAAIAVASACVLALTDGAFAQDAAGRTDSPSPAPPNAPQVQRLLLELRVRAAELDERELEIERRERAATDLEREITQRLDEWQGVRAELDQKLAELEAGFGDRASLLAKTYGVMPAERSSALLVELSPDLATAILTRMKSKRAAAVLAAMPEDAALLLSNRIAVPIALSEGNPR